MARATLQVQCSSHAQVLRLCASDAACMCLSLLACLHAHERNGGIYLRALTQYMRTQESSTKLVSTLLFDEC